MELNSQNRIADTKQRGRPSKADIAARGEPVPVEPIAVVEKRLPQLQPIICSHCGRSMWPKIIRTAPDRRTVSCTFCAKQMQLLYLPDLRQVVSKL